MKSTIWTPDWKVEKPKAQKNFNIFHEIDHLAPDEEVERLKNRFLMILKDIQSKKIVKHV